MGDFVAEYSDGGIGNALIRQTCKLVAADPAAHEEWASKNGQAEPYIGGTWSYENVELEAEEVLAAVKKALDHCPGSEETLRALLPKPVPCEVLVLDRSYQGGYKKVKRTRAAIGEHVVELLVSDEFDFMSMK
eukprot:CAMPEP_0172915358 /NCGR_PEP_ID=MMETSP1075-20121228/194170_1 /TAXON_ID=2916 /ORGANISM="Ceratium fusus, Strain PA161109" /LENGTH=132 /DNA_ID=CAMNT_0013774429 /DNA_START=68 /DNA_END=466 /DNA_ORIENTATION=+